MGLFKEMQQAFLKRVAEIIPTVRLEAVEKEEPIEALEDMAVETASNEKPN